MNNKAHPVRNFFYQDNDQPGFSFERFFPINLLVNQKTLTGEDWSYPNDEYLKVAYTYKTLTYIIKDSLFLDETKNFISNLIINLPIVFPSSFIEVWKNEEFPKIIELLAPSEAALYREYLDNNLEKAYFFSSQNSITHTIWALWIDKIATYKQLNDLLYYNWKKFELASRGGFGKNEKNTSIDWMCDFFGINSEERTVLEFFYFEEKQKVISSIITSAKTFKYYSMVLNTEEHIEWFAKIYEVKKSDIISLFKNKER